MAMLTTCPACHTRFRVTPEQLEAHRGDVRCGRCAKVFNARAYLEYDAEPDSQPVTSETEAATSPESQPEAALQIQTTETFLFEILPEPQPEQAAAPDVAESAAPETAEVAEVAEIAAATETPEQVEESTATEAPAEAAAEPAVPEEIDAVAEPAPVPEPTEDSSFAAAFREQAESTVAEKKKHAAVSERVLEESFELEPVRSRRRWLWLLGILLLLLVLAGQALYFFRTELASRYPAAKPFLLEYCAVLRCTVPLPANPDLLSIDSSNLEADPQQASQVTLHAILRNRARFAQEYPQLELSLTDTQDKVVARRIFSPREYAGNADLARGMPPNEEVQVKLRLDIGDLKASGYRVFLFYPQ